MRRAVLAAAAGLFLLPASGHAQISGAAGAYRYSGADADRRVSGAGANPRVSGAKMPPAPPGHVSPAPKMPPDYTTPTPPSSHVPMSGDSDPAFTYRAPTDWTPPTGLAYRHFAYGQSLPLPFFARRYWIDDYPNYYLGTAQAGTVWVRVGPDALLVDKTSRKVLQAQYGLFR